MLRSAASDQGLHCLPMSPLWDARHKRVLAQMWFYVADADTTDRLLDKNITQLPLSTETYESQHTSEKLTGDEI